MFLLIVRKKTSYKGIVEKATVNQRVEKSSVAIESFDFIRH